MKAKLREVLEKFAEAIGDEYLLRLWKAGQDNSISMARDEAEAAILELMPRWVSVEEDLPQFEDWVLAYDSEYLPFQFIAQRIDPDTEGWSWVAWSPTGWHSVSPTHWMPLPTPPEAEKEGE